MAYEQIEVAIDTAKENYLSFLEKMKNLNPLPPRPEKRASYIGDDTLTVGEIKKQLAEYQEAESKQRTAKSQTNFMKQMRLVGLTHFNNYLWDLDLPEHTVIWGHRHGEVLTYKDLKT
jgi:hypothetical protein